MKRILLLQLFLFTAFGFAQVGVNTTTPDPSSMLDVTATNKGALFPRVSLSNINLTTLDGTNPAATGLLIWNTNAATIGGNGVGYYFFNGTIWVPVFQSNQTIDVFSLTGSTLNLSLQNDGVATQTLDLSSLLGDDDWTDVGVDIERQVGNVYIGDTSGTNNNLYISNQIIDWDNVTYTIDPNGDSVMNEIQFDNGTTADPSIRFSEANTGFFSPTTDVFAYSANGTEAFRIHPNGNISVGQTVDPNFKISVSNTAGLNNVRIGNNNSTDSVVEIDHNGDSQNSLEVNSNSAYTLASRSAISANNSYVDTAVDISRYEIGANASYGIKSINSNSFGIFSGSHYGIYSEALQTNGYAGYFLGRMSIGTTAVNNYILPPSRGTNGQFMQTDGVGNVSWVNASAIDTDNQIIDVLSLTGDVLNISLQDDGVATQTLNLAAIDNQATDIFSLTGTTLNLSLQNDGVATQTVNLASLDTDNQIIDVLSLTGDVLNISLQDDGVATQTLNLGAIDNQGTDVFSLTGTTLNLSLQNDGVATQTVDLSSLSDHDWYEIGTTTAPNAITDNIYTQGKASIGSSTLSNGKFNVYNSAETYSLYAENSSSPAGNTYTAYLTNSGTGANQRYGLLTDVSGAGSGMRYGIFNTNNSTSTGNQGGVYNFLTGSGGDFIYGLRNYITATGSGAQQQFGVYNDLSTVSDSQIMGVYNFNPSNGNGIHYGTHNRILGNGNGVKYGTYNFIMGTGTGMRYGNYNYITGNGTNNKYGTYNLIDPLAAGTHFGLYSEALKTGSYAGYFLGDVSVGTTTANNYVLPPSRGTNGQIMQTNGTGVVTWVNPGAAESTTANNGLTETVNNVQLGGALVQNTTLTQGTFNMDINLNNTGDFSIQDNGTDVLFVEDTGEIGIGTSTPAYPLHMIENGAVDNAFFLDKTETSANNTSGIFINKTGQGTGRSHAIFTDVDGTGTGQKYGVFNQISSTAAGNQYGTRNFISGSSPSSQFGTFNNLDNAGTGIHYGNYNGMRGTSAATLYANYNEFDNATTAANSYGNYTSFSANATGIGDKYGTYNTINTAIPGTHYGTYNSVGVANGWAGYFLGRNYISDREAIGETDNPNAGLSINKNSTGTYSHIELKETTANDGARLTFSNTAEVTNNWLLYGRADNTITDSRFNIFHTTTGNIMQITGDGLVGILRAPTTNQLEINGTASKSAAGGFLANSDSRLKKNIVTISPTEALEKVLSLRGVTYEWNDNKTGMNRPEGTQLGFVAQEIQQVFPEKVTEDKQGYLQTAYGDYDPIIFQAIKALSDKIDKLEKENEELKKRIEDKK